jgi:glucose-induced degradation protein 8
MKLSTEQLEHVNKRAQIRDAIHVGRIPQAIALIDQMYPDLLKTDSHLYFLLQQQHLIELIRQSNDEEALAFAQVIIC